MHVGKNMMSYSQWAGYNRIGVWIHVECDKAMSMKQCQDIEMSIEWNESNKLMFVYSMIHIEKVACQIIMWQLLYCSFNQNFEHWTYPNIITRPKLGARVMKTPIKKINVILFDHNRTGFHLTNLSIFGFSILQCREGWICTFLDPNIIQCTDQMGVDLLGSIHP